MRGVLGLSEVLLLAYCAPSDADYSGSGVSCAVDLCSFKAVLAILGVVYECHLFMRFGENFSQLWGIKGAVLRLNLTSGDY